MRTPANLLARIPRLCLLACMLLAACGDPESDPVSTADVGPDAPLDTNADVGVDVPDDAPDSADAPPDAPPTAATELEFPVGPPAVPRLTALQFENAIHDVFGSDIVVPHNIEPDLQTAGFLQIGAAGATISPRGVEKYEQAAYTIAEQVVDGDFRADFACALDGIRSDDCAGPWLSETATRAWRRPVTDAELAVLVDVAGDSAEVLTDFFDGLEFAVALIVQSPSFLFRAELGEDDPERAGERRYSNYDMASRLSFLVWNTVPDSELLRAAADGELTTDDGLRSQTERLLADPRARTGLGTFFEELYELHELSELNKDPNIFPSYSPDLGPAARTETLMDIEHVVFDLDTDIRELISSRRTFIDRRLAALYDVRAPAREGFAETMLPEGELRRGLLGQASILALNSHATSNSATLRGKYVRENFLCGEIPPPPSGVDTSIPEPTEVARTLRERVAQHLEDELCAGCHTLMDPLGLALEHFDAIGAFRTLDNGVDVDDSGNFDGLEFSGFDEFVDLMATDPRLTYCYVQKLYRYGSSTLEDFTQANALAGLHDLFEHQGFRFQGLVLDYVMSPAFRQVGEIE